MWMVIFERKKREEDGAGDHFVMRGRQCCKFKVRIPVVEFREGLDVRIGGLGEGGAE